MEEEEDDLYGSGPGDVPTTNNHEDESEEGEDDDDDDDEDDESVRTFIFLMTRLSADNDARILRS